LDEEEKTFKYRTIQALYSWKLKKHTILRNSI